MKAYFQFSTDFYFKDKPYSKVSLFDSPAVEVFSDMQNIAIKKLAAGCISNRYYLCSHN